MAMAHKNKRSIMDELRQKAEESLRQQIDLTLENSIKFTHSGSIVVRVSRNTTPLKKGNLLFQITDSGIGISKEQENKLFLPYLQ